MPKLATLMALAVSAAVLASACGDNGQPGATARDRIAFESCRAVEPLDPESYTICDIYIIRADGSDPINLTNYPEAAEYFDNTGGTYSWSPDGSRIAFDYCLEGNCEIYLANADGSELTNLTANPAFDAGPMWLPDGNRIVFASDRDHAGGMDSMLYVMNADGSAVARLTEASFSDTGCCSALTLSPDGTRLAADAERDGNFDIYVMNADGSDYTRLTNNPYGDVDPVWSPDGTRIAFVSWSIVGPETSDIYAINADGSNLTRLTDRPEDDHGPVWSPDGERIAFFTYETDSSGNFGSAIYVMNADGTGQVRLTSDPRFESYPAWSADGTRLAFVIDDDSDGDISVMNSDGSAQTNITNSPADDAGPAWQPAP